jgi:hypothetical protein
MSEPHVERVIVDARTHRLRFLREGAPMSWAAVSLAWQRDPAFSSSFAVALRDTPFAAFFWESPPVSGATRGRACEHVIVDAPRLAGVRAEPDAFEDHFAKGEPIATFANLGADAVLVAPAPFGDPQSGAHLAAFLRAAPPDRVEALFAAVGRAFDARLERPEPVWLSTSGVGVRWLHVRLDDRPKYITHRPYRDAA